MGKNYQIFKNAYEQEDLKNPLDVTIVDLLTDRSEGCELNIIVDPKDDFDREEVKNGGIITEKFALNYGPRGNASYKYRVIIQNPETSKIYHLDNAFDDKKFGLIKDNNIFSIWRESDKISKWYTFQGNIKEVFKELKSRGYSFLEQTIEDKDHRIEKVKQHLKEHNIYYTGLNEPRIE